MSNNQFYISLMHFLFTFLRFCVVHNLFVFSYHSKKPFLLDGMFKIIKLKQNSWFWHNELKPFWQIGFFLISTQFYTMESWFTAKYGSEIWAFSDLQHTHTVAVTTALMMRKAYFTSSPAQKKSSKNLLKRGHSHFNSNNFIQSCSESCSKLYFSKYSVNF